MGKKFDKQKLQDVLDERVKTNYIGEGESYAEYLYSLDVYDKGNINVTKLPRWKSIVLGWLVKLQDWIVKL